MKYIEAHMTRSTNIVVLLADFPPVPDRFTLSYARAVGLSIYFFDSE